MNDNRAFAGLFGRKVKRNSLGSAVEKQQQDLIRPSYDTHISQGVSQSSDLALDEVSKPRRISDESKPFFRLPRQRKATSLTKSEESFGRKSTERSDSNENGRPSIQSIRAPFEALFRPSLSARSSATSVVTPMNPGAALVASSTSLAVQGSPKIEQFPATSAAMSRQNSVRSIASLRSSRSLAISDQSPNSGSPGKLSRLVNRGRSLTYAGKDSNRKGGPAERPSKFFSLARLRRDDTNELALFHGLSIDRSPQAPSSPGRSTSTLDLLPAPECEETGSTYLARLELKVPRTLIASLLAQDGNTPYSDALTCFMQHFDFIDDPLDIALRKFLMENHLPKETQQIDRVISAFSGRYHDCNSRLFETSNTPYVLTFALLMLHTDRFNQNNKNKMTKAQFMKNITSEETSQIPNEVLAYFYDNITCTPFIYVEDEQDELAISNHSTPVQTPPAGIRSGSISAMSQGAGYFGRRNMDLYTLILEGRLESLQPQLSPILTIENTLSFSGTLPVLNINKLHSAFTHPATLQLVSARSRPEAFVDDDAVLDPLATEPGLVDIQITKIGILRRKEQKKANSKPVYREWGVMLTPSQLLLFKNIGWIKPYLHQARDRAKDKACILTPPVHNYSPDTYLPTSDTVAIHDSHAKKPTHFSFYGRGGQQTQLVATSEEEMNDWVAKINYAAAFHTTGIRIRGTDTSESQNGSMRKIKRHVSTVSTMSSVTISGTTATQQEIATARRSVLKGKIDTLAKQVREKEEQLSLYQQHARNLCTLTPIQPRTRAQIITSAGSLSAKMSWARMELCKAQCHYSILSKDLELETNPDANAFTTPQRPSTPTSDVMTQKSSPSKNKLNILRQVSTDTMRRVNRKISTSTTSSKRVSSPIPTHARGASEFSIPDVELTPESLSLCFSNSPEKTKDEGSDINPFILHGRKVSLVQTPISR